MSLVRWIALLVVLVGVAAGRGVAHAGGGVSDQAAAEQLFEEGRRLEAAGRFADACPKYAESERHDSSAGTMLRLANCYEKIGKTASAWVIFKDAVKAAEARKRSDWVSLARAHAAALEPKLSKVIVRVDSGADVTGLQITRDGSSVGSAELGVAIPVDPGEHHVEATGPHRKAWSGSADVAAGATVTVVVPVLAAQPDEVAPAVAPTPDAGDANASKRRTRMVIALATGGVGVAALALGTIAGVVTIDKHSSAVAGCTDYPHGCSSAAVSANNDGYTWAAVSTFGFVLGAVAAAASIVVVLTMPKAASPTARLWFAPAIGANAAGLGVGGAW